MPPADRIFTMKNSAEDVRTQRESFTDKVPNPDKPGNIYKYSAKEKLFVFHYLTDAEFNGSAAAKLAKYKAGSDLSFRVIASNLLKKPKIKAAINVTFEALTMPKFEVLYRIGRIAAGDLNDLLDDAGNFSIEAARERGTTHLLKKVSITRSRREVKRTEVDTPDDAPAEFIESSIIDETIKFEIDDRLKALELLGKHSGVFPDSRISVRTGSGSAEVDEPANVVIFIPDNGRGDALPGLGSTNRPERALSAGKPKPKA